MSSIKRIIIIDDDPIATRISCHVIKRILPEIEVCSFTSPEKGLEFILKEYLVNPVRTILFLDINMPMISGWEVLDKLEYYETLVKEHLLIYICSSSISYYDKALCSQHPFIIDFVEKPMTKLKLMDMLKREYYNSNKYMEICSIA